MICSKALALENLGFCYEYLNHNTYEVIPGLSVRLTDDQLLVRGELEPFHEQGMETKTMWAVFEKHLYRIYNSSYDALFGIEPGDKVYILGFDKKTILHEGYFNEFDLPGIFKWGGREIMTLPNRPQLFSDPELKNLLVDHNELAHFFADHYPTVVIKNKNPKLDYEENRRAMRVMHAFNNHPKRFVKVTDHFTYAREFAENVVEVIPRRIDDPFYNFNLKSNPVAVLGSWIFEDLDGTRVDFYLIKKVFGFDIEDHILFQFEGGRFNKSKMNGVLSQGAHRIFVVVQ